MELWRSVKGTFVVEMEEIKMFKCNGANYLKDQLNIQEREGIFDNKTKFSKT